MRRASIWDVGATRYYSTEPSSAEEEEGEDENRLLTLNEMKETFQRGGGLYVSFVKKSTGESR